MSRVALGGWANGAVWSPSFPLPQHEFLILIIVFLRFLGIFIVILIFILSWGGDGS